MKLLNGEKKIIVTTWENNRKFNNKHLKTQNTKKNVFNCENINSKKISWYHTL